MSLRRGLRAITGIYSGAREVTRVYRGTALVYDSGGSHDRTVRDSYIAENGDYSFSEISGSSGVAYTWTQSTRTLAVQDYEDADRPTEGS